MRKDITPNPARKRWRKLGGRVFGPWPHPYRGVEQQAIVIDPARPLRDQVPPRCPKCHAAALALVDLQEIHCTGLLAGCGATWRLVAGDPIDLDPTTVRGHYDVREEEA